MGLVVKAIISNREISCNSLILYLFILPVLKLCHMACKAQLSAADTETGKMCSFPQRVCSLEVGKTVKPNIKKYSEMSKGCHVGYNSL